MKGQLEGNLVVVTGASGDIGGAIALAAGEAGATVIGTYNAAADRAARLEAEAAARHLDVHLMKVDISDEGAVKSFFSEVSARHGLIDSLICAAGHSSKRTWFAGMDELSAEKWLEVLKVDVVGSFFCCREASKHMKEGSSVVFFSSAAGVTGHWEGLPYTAAKAALIGVTKSLAMMLGPKIRVNAVAPGNIDAGSVVWYDEDGRRKMAEESSLKRLGSREEVAQVALFLASKGSSFVSGQVLLVDGGI
jgi:3-oxoacyl-[acyl-carrier protein] reductase